MRASRRGLLRRFARAALRRPPLASLLVTALLGAAPALAGPDGFLARWAPPVDVSKDGYRSDALFWYTSTMGLVAFTLVVLALAAFSLMYRERPGHKALYHHGTDRKSYAVTGVLAALVFVTIDMNLVRVSQRDVKDYLYKFPSSPDTVRIEVMPQQWAWNFRYPGPDGVFNTPDDVVTLNDLRIPEGRPVMLNLKAKDVIHSFYIPNFRIKQDANPGSVTRMWFQAKAPGRFEIACSQMCGWAHYKMRGELTVLPEADYQRWIREEEDDAKRRFDPADTEQLWGWEWMQ